MTCADMQAICVRLVRDTTRAERGAAAGHYLRCPECREWFDSPQRPWARAVWMDNPVSQADLADPEYLAAVLGPRETLP